MSTSSYSAIVCAILATHRRLDVTSVPTLARGSAGVIVLQVWTGEASIGAGLTQVVAGQIE
jgi:hypothetical protein